MAVRTQPRSNVVAEVAVRLVDADVHIMMRSQDELREYIAPAWQKRWTEFAGLVRVAAQGGMTPPNNGLRQDARPIEGWQPGSDPAALERELFGRLAVDFAILKPMISGDFEDPDFDAALKSAANNWLADTWLSRHNGHGAYRGGIAISVRNPRAAVAEIERWAGHPGFVEVQVGHSSRNAYGDERYDPIWESAARHGLPVAMHHNTMSGSPMTGPAGHFQYYPDFHGVGHAHVHAAQLTSLVCGRTFERIPELRFVFVEGGFGWLSSVLWRLDGYWRRLRDEPSALKRPPSSYVYDHVRFTSQPVEEPDDRRDLARLFELWQADRLLMFATDYPHWDFDDPKRAMPRLPAEAAARIFAGNAIDLYGLPRVRPVRAGEEE